MNHYFNYRANDPIIRDMPFLVLILLFILVPLAEITVLISVSGNIGVAKTLLLVIVTAILGAALVKQQGTAVLASIREQMNAGQTPAVSMIEGLMLFLAGAVLLTPGFITDAAGFLLLVPTVRTKLANYMLARMFVVQPHSDFTSSERTQRRDPTIIEGEYKDQ